MMKEKEDIEMQNESDEELSTIESPEKDEDMMNIDQGE